MNNKIKKPRIKISRKTKILSASIAVGAGIGFAVAGHSMVQKKKVTSYEALGFTYTRLQVKTGAQLTADIDTSSDGTVYTIAGVSYHHIKAGNTGTGPLAIYADAAGTNLAGAIPQATRYVLQTGGAGITYITEDADFLSRFTIPSKTGSAEDIREYTDAKKAAWFTFTGLTKPTGSTINFVSVTPQGPSLKSLTVTYTITAGGTTSAHKTFTIGFTKSKEERDDEKIIFDLNALYAGSTGAANLYAGTTTTKIPGVPVGTMDEAALKTLLAHNGVINSGSWGVSITTPYHSDDASADPTIGFKFTTTHATDATAKTPTIHYVESRQTKAIRDAQALLTTAIGTIDTKLGTAVTKFTSDTFGLAEFRTYIGTLANGVTITIANAANPSDLNIKTRALTYTLSVVGTNGAGTQTLPVTAKTLTFTGSANDKIIKDLNDKYSSSAIAAANLYAGTGATLITGTPLLSGMNAAALKTLLEQNGVTNVGSWGVSISPTYSSTDASADATIGFKFTAGGATDTTAKTSTIHYVESRQTKAIRDAQALLTTAIGTIDTKLGTAVTKFTSDTFGLAEFRTYIGTLANGVTITIANAANPSDLNTKTRALTYTLSVVGTNGAGTQTLPVTAKTLTFTKSSNDKTLSDIDVLFASKAANLYTRTGTTAITGTPPTSLTNAQLRTLLVDNGIPTAGGWTVTQSASQFSALTANDALATPTITYKFHAGNSVSASSKVSHVHYTQSRRAASDANLRTAEGTIDSAIASTISGFTTQTWGLSQLNTLIGSTLPTGVTITAATVGPMAVATNSDIKTRSLSYTLSITPTHGGVTFTKTISSKTLTFAKSSNDEILSKLEGLFTPTAAHLYKSTGTTAIADTPPLTMTPAQLQAILIANGVTTSGAWTVTIDSDTLSASTGNDALAIPTITYKFNAGNSHSATAKVATLHYHESRKTKSDKELQTAEGTINTAIAATISGFTTQTFGQTEFIAKFGSGLPSGVTIKTVTVGASSANTDGKTRSLEYTLSITPTHGGVTFTKPISSKTLTFAQSSNDEMLSKLEALFRTNGGTLFKAGGLTAIANIPPTSLSDTDLHALLIANGVDTTGTWTVTQSASQLPTTPATNDDLKTPTITYKFHAGNSVSTSDKVSTLTYTKSRNQKLVDDIQQSDFTLSTGLASFPPNVGPATTAFTALPGGVTITSVTWNSWSDQKFAQTATIVITQGNSTKTFNNVPFTFTKRKQEVATSAATALLHGATGIIFAAGSTTNDGTILIPHSLTTSELLKKNLKMQISTKQTGRNWIDAPSSSVTITPPGGSSTTVIGFHIPDTEALSRPSSTNGGNNSKELWVRFVSTDTAHVIVPTPNNGAKVKDVVNNIPDYIDTTSMVLGGITISGNTNAPILNEGPVTSLLKNEGTTATIAAGATRVQVVYSLTGGSAITDVDAKHMGFTNLAAATGAGVKPWMTKAEFEAIFNTAHPERNIAYLNSGTYTTFTITTKLRVKPKSTMVSSNNKDAQLSNDNSVNLAPSKMTALVKWTNVAELVANLNDGHINFDTTKNSNTALWTTTGSLNVQQLVAKAALLGFKLQFSLDATSSTSGTWTDVNTATIVKLDFTHANRNLWMRIAYSSDPKGLITTDVISDKVGHKVTTSNIQAIKSWVDTSSWASTGVTATGLTTSITLGGTLTAPTGSKIVYSSDGTTWKEKAAFITWALTNNPKRTDIKAKLVPTDATKYDVFTGEEKEGVITIAGLYSHKNISALTALLNIAGGRHYSGAGSQTASAGTIVLGGSIGATGAVFTVPPELYTAALETLGLKLQWTTDKTKATWTDAVIRTNTIGFASYPNSQAITLTKATAADDAFLALRIVPIKDDKGIAKAAASKDNYEGHVTATMVKPGNYFAGQVGPYYQVDTTKIPILVKAPSASLTGITFTGTTRNLVIDENKVGTGSQTPSAFLSGLNGNNNYWTDGSPLTDNKRGITLKYSFDDGAHPNLWLEKADFIKFLKDGLPIAGIAGTNTKPNWNNINMANFKVKWDAIKGTVTPDDKVEKSVTATFLKKWIDTTAIITRLKAMTIGGNTWAMTPSDLGGIITALDTLTGGHNFKITFTNANSAVTGATNTQVDTLVGLHMKDNLELHFQISPVTGAEFVASKAITPTAFDPKDTWNHAGNPSSATFLRWVNVDKAQLPAGVVLSGNTKTLVSSTVASSITDSIDGVIGSGATRGVEVVYNLTGAHHSATDMLLPAFKTYLYGLAHDGTWGASNIVVGYRAKTSYEIPATMTGVDQHPTVTNVKRYIDVSSLVAKLSSIKVRASQETSDGVHVDSKHVLWDMDAALSSINADLHAELEFLLKGTNVVPSPGDTWSKTLPTMLDDEHSKRHLFVRIVEKGKAGTEEVILSHGTIDAAGLVRTIAMKDITTSSTIIDTLTNIDLGSSDFKTLALTGNTKTMVFDETAINRTGLLLSAATLYYYFEGAPLDSNGIPTGSTDLTKKYTKAQFITYLSTHFATVQRLKIRTVIVANSGHAFKPSDIAKIKAQNHPNVAGLYSHYDMSSLTPFLQLNSPTQNAIKLSGIVGLGKFVVYDLPPELLKAALLLRHLKLQFSNIENHPSNSWKDSTTTNISASTGAEAIAASANGEKIELLPDAAGVGHLAFRLVPVTDDTTPGVEQSVVDKSNYDQYVTANMAKPSDYVAGGKYYTIDTTKIPKLVLTDTSGLSTIKIVGNTHQGNPTDITVTIGSSNEDLNAAILRANPGKDAATMAKYQNFITLKYSIDDGQSRLWLEKAEFLNYLKTGTHTVAATGSVPSKTYTLDYVNIHFNSVQVMWASTDTEKFVPSQPAATNINSAELMKWVDVQSTLDQLKGLTGTDKLELSGDTHHLVDTHGSLAKILASLRALPNPDTAEFEIWVTNKFSAAGIPNFTGHTTNALPTDLTDKYELAFKIVSTNGSTNKYFLATGAAIGVEKPEVKWATTTAATTIKKWIDAQRTTLTAVELKGDTQSVDMTVNNDLISSKDRAIVSASTPDSLIGLEVWYRVGGTKDGDSTFNNNALPEAVFKAYLDGTLTLSGSNVLMGTTDVTKYGFTATNYKITHDGSWGTADIRVGFHAKPGYKILEDVFVATSPTAGTNTKSFADVKPNVTGLNRYIDIKLLLDKKDLIKIDDTGTYIDSKNLHFIIDDLLKASPGPGTLNGKLYWSTKTTKPSATDSTWTLTVPTEVPDTGRKLWVMFKPTVVASETVHLSDGVGSTGATRTYTPHVYDISNQAGITITDTTKVPTNIATAGITLNKVVVQGETNNIVITDGHGVTGQTGNAASHAFVGYTITNFLAVTDTFAQKLGFANAAAATAAGLKPMMTNAEFKLFVNGDGSAANPAHTILRERIKVRLEADPGYSIVPADKTATKHEVINTDLYSYIDAKTQTSKMLLENTLTGGAVKLQGRIGPAGGVLFSFPSEFSPAALEKLNLKMQFTITGTSSTTPFNPASTNLNQYKNMTIDPNAVWTDTNLVPVARTATNGFASVALGEIITLSKKNGYAYLAFRLVPIKTDEGVSTTGFTDTNNYAEYITKSMSKPSDLVDSGQKMAPTRNGVFHSINTSLIPTTVFTQSSQLSNIKFTGDTRHLVINETKDGLVLTGTGSSSNALMNTLRDESGNKNAGTFDEGFMQEIEVLYTIDNDAAGNPIWLDKLEMEAYLNGGLHFIGGKTVFKSGGKEVPQLTAAGRAVPDYVALNIADIKSKWATAKSVVPVKFVPSQTTAVKPTITAGTDKTTSFRKWFDAKPFKDDIKVSVVNGDTHAYTIDLKNAAGNPSANLDAAYLTTHGLKIQYSNDGITWSDTKFDFTTATWAIQVARKLKMRVIPLDTSAVIIGDSYSDEGRNNTNEWVLNLEKDASNNKLFRTYLDVNKVELAHVQVKGSNHELWGYADASADQVGSATLGLLQNNLTVHVDDDNAKYGQLEIVYLYNTKWLNKADLLTAIETRKTTKQDPPADFMPGHIKAKWRVEDNKEYVIKTGEDAENLIDSTRLTEWVNTFGIQERTDDENHKEEPTLPPFAKFVGGTLTTHMDEKGAGVSLDTAYELTGDLKELMMTWKAGGILGEAKTDKAILNAHHMKVQFSVSETPGNTLGSTDWKDGWPGSSGTGAQVNAVHRSLWIRFVPQDSTHFTLGNSFRSAASRERLFVPIKIDTTKVKYSIKVSAAVLANLKFTGTTQSFVKGGTDAAGNIVVAANAVAIEESAYNNSNQAVDASGTNLGHPISDDDKVNKYAIIAYKVTATRTNSTYTAGQDYTFETEVQVAKFLADVKSGLLNFYAKTLQVAWRIQDNKAINNVASEPGWTKPNTDELQNFVYTEDITTLTDASYEILGNNIKITIGLLKGNTAADLDPAALKALGVKVQYNISVDPASITTAESSAQEPNWIDWDDTDGKNKPLKNMPAHKNIYIRFVAISTTTRVGSLPKYITKGTAAQVGKGPVDGRQIVKLDTSKSKVAIALDPAFMTKFSGMTVTGKTKFGEFVIHPGTVPAGDILTDLMIPQVLSTDQARYQYSIGEEAIPGDPSSVIWNDSLEAVLKDKYNKGFKSLDKDRDLKGLMVRMLVKDDVNFVLTMPNGTEFTEVQREKTIVITGLIQPIYTDVPMSTLPSSATWASFANEGKFKPSFLKGGTSKEATFIRLAFDGQNPVVSGEESLYRLNANVFFPTDRTKDIDRSAQEWNALAPRHTHFVFQYRADDSILWSTVPKTTTPPSIYLKTSTNYKGFKVTLVAGDVNTDGTMKDGTFELPGAGTPVGEQGWSREFNIVLLKATAPISVDKIEFMGFQEVGGAAGHGVIKRDSATDPNLGKPIIKFKDASGNPIADADLFGEKAFTLEYRVTHGGADVSWTDTDGKTSPGWHIFPHSPVEGSASYPKDGEYGYPPVSLKNGDFVMVRLRANDGWVIEDTGSTDTNPNGYSKWSHEMNPIEVTGLNTKIEMPTDMRIYTHNPKFNVNAAGTQITPNSKMPVVSFAGSDGKGTVSFTPGSFKYAALMKPEVQLLRPWRPTNQNADVDIFDSTTLEPKFGYEIVKTTKDASGNFETVVVFITPAGHAVDPATAGGQEGWLKDTSTIPDSWRDPSTVNTLSVSDSLNVRYIANPGYAFEWEDKRQNFGTATMVKPYVDIWVPKTHSSRIFNENKDGKSYKSIKVSNLLVIPRHKIADVLMGYGAIKDPATSIPFSKPYNGFATPKPNLMPKPGDKWRWVYSTDGSTWTPSGSKNFKNGDKFWMKAVPLSSNFGFASSYNKNPRQFAVSGLTSMINTKYIARPVLTFEGLIGHGKISKVVASTTTGKNAFTAATATQLAQPVATLVGTGIPVEIHHGVTWEFQISDTNPAAMSPLDVDKLKWTKDEPKTLRIGQYIRMRVAPINPVDGVEPPLYSVASPKADARKGWNEVKNLKVDQANIDFEPVIGGFIGRTIITPKMLNNSIDELGIIMEAMIVSRKSGTPGPNDGKWVAFKDLKDLKNGDVLSYRAIANKKRGYIIDPSQPNAFVAATSSGNAYIQKGSWKNQPIGSLKSYLDVDSVSLKTVHIIRDLRHPKPNDPLYVKQDPNDPKAKIPLAATDILSGSATISTASDAPTINNDNANWATHLDLITSGVPPLPMPDGVKIQFTVQKYDPDSATYTEIAPTNAIPFGLKNMDRVKVELVPVDPAVYKLSSERSIWITMKGLVQPSPKLNQPPILTFMGQNGEGTVLVTPIAQSGFKWVYNVQKIGKPETDVFVDEVPKKLENGDRVRVELASAIKGVSITNTYRTDFLTVSNLVFKFDMSNIKIDFPERIMNIIGKQEKDTKIHAKDPSRLTSGGQVIEHTKKMKWKFLVVHEGDKNVPTHSSEFKNALPEKLVNGDKVYAILVSTDPNTEVIGFKPIMTEIKGLKPESRVSGKMSVMIMAIGGGILTAGLATAAVFIMKNRKKRML